MVSQVVDLDRVQRPSHQQAQPEDDPLGCQAGNPQRVVISIVDHSQTSQKKDERKETSTDETIKYVYD